MKFIHTIIFLLLSLVSFAQVDVRIPNAGSVATREWVKVYLDSWLQKIPPKSDTVTVPNPGTGTPCGSAGPTLTSVYDVQPSQISFSFAGNIQTINWSIIQGTTVIRTGGVVPVVRNVEISFVTLPSGSYKFKIDGTACTNSFAIAFTVSSPAPVCVGGPVINAILSKTRTSLSFNWTGVNVPELVWTIKQAGTIIRSGSASTVSQSLTINYSTIPYGPYDFQIVGLTCPTTSPSVSFTLTDTSPPVTTTGRHVYMNFTGYGFDINDPTGLSSEWRERAEAFLNLNYLGNNFKGIDGIRVNVNWRDYEPTEGNFNDTKLLAALNWCIDRGIRLSITLIPWRREGDGMFPDYDKCRLMDNRIWYMEGDLPTTYRTYQPSVNSPTAHTKFKNVARHMAQVLAQYPNNVDYISTATAQTEEYQLIRQESPLMMTGYGDVDKALWATYSSGLPVPYPSSNDEDGINAMMLTSTGRTWYEYHTNGLRQLHAAFVQGVREGSSNGLPRAAGMYAGVGAPSGVFNFTYKLNTIYSAGGADQPSVIYSSEGDAGGQRDKLMATDLNLGTFPGSDPAIEFDPDDISVSQVRNPPWDADMSSDILYNYSESFFKRGGKIVHFAMAFNPAKIPQLARALWDIKTKFLDSSTGMTSIDQGGDIVFPTVRYTGLQEYRGMWSDAGAGINKRVKIILQ